MVFSDWIAIPATWFHFIRKAMGAEQLRTLCKLKGLPRETPSNSILSRKVESKSVLFPSLQILGR
jgi:hypothetical protein